MSSTPRNSPWTSVGLVLLTVLFCLGTLEAGLRIRAGYGSFRIDGYYEPDEGTYRLKKNASQTVRWPTTTFSVHTCDLGFRNSQPGPRHFGQRPYVAVLGASEVFGDGLNYEQSFIGVFAEHMKRRSFDVVNLAVGGHSLDEQARLFGEFSRSGQPAPAEVLIVLNPLLMQEYDKDHREVTVHRGHLFGRDWKMAYAKVILQKVSLTYTFLRDRFRNIQQKYFNRADYAAGYYEKMYSKQNPLHAPARREDFLRHLRNLEDDIVRLKATPVCVYCPTPGGFMLAKLKAQGQVNPQEVDTDFFRQLAKSHCLERGVRFVDLEPPLQKLFDKGEKLNIDLDSHFNAATSRVVGDALFAALDPAKPGAPK
jgi:hypothetical protein